MPLELEDLLNNLQSERQHVEAVRIITRYLRRRAVQRLDETTQAQKLKEARDAHDVDKIRAFAEVSQFGRVKQQADEFLRRINDYNNQPPRIRVLQPLEPRMSEDASCEK